jgi:hypothetical protein
MSTEKQNPDCPRCALGDGWASVKTMKNKHLEEISITALAVLFAFSEDTKNMTHLKRAAVAETLINELKTIVADELAAGAAQN